MKAKKEVIKLGKKEIVIKHQGATKRKCQELGYSSGCNPQCLKKLEEMGGIWLKRARLAKALCKLRKRKSK